MDNIQFDINGLKYDEKGLIPAIVQDFDTKRVLTLAYMNRESLEITIQEGRTCFWSRSRQSLWRKGETSGNGQQVVRILVDCDRDCLLLDVIQTGVACHTGSYSCFDETVYVNDKFKPPFTTKQLHETIVNRRDNPNKDSYTTKLFDKGIDTILKKVGEESAEVIIAAKGGERDNTIYELADLYYHISVMMANANITPEEVEAELARRHSNPKVD